MSNFSQIYTCELPKGKTWRVSVIPEAEDVDFNLTIEDPNGREIAQDVSPDADAYCTFTSLSSGTYRLKVEAVRGNSPFNIKVEPVSIVFTRSYYYRLEEGRTWNVAVIATSPDVDFNLHIENPNGEAIAQDSSPDANAHCIFTSSMSGVYCFRIESLKGVSDFNLKIEPIS